MRRRSRKGEWCVAMVIRFPEKVGVLQGLELHGRIVCVFHGKNSVPLHKQSCKIKRLSCNV